MNYWMELSYNNHQESFYIPVLPPSIEMSEGGAGSTFNVTGLGEINVIKDRKLSEISFSSFFPAEGSLFLLEEESKIQSMDSSPRPKIDYKPPHEYVTLIMKWMETKRPIRFKYQGASFAINSSVSIEAFQWKEVAGGGGDIEYSIKLKHYVFYAAKKVIVREGQTASQTKRPDDREMPRTYTLRAGDSLWKVAQMFLGNGSRWKEIQSLNGIKDAEIRRLPIGKVLKLP